MLLYFFAKNQTHMTKAPDYKGLPLLYGNDYEW